MDKIKRYIGFDNLDKFKEILIEYKLKAENDASYVFIEKQLPNSVDIDLVYDLSTVIDNDCNINEELLKGILLKYEISLSKYECIKHISDIYKTNEKNTNKNILSNFIAKMVMWIKNYIGNENINYKIIYLGAIKKHDVYFLILMNLFKYSVFYFTLEEHDEFLRIKDIDNYSTLIKGENHISEKDEKLSDIIKKEFNKVNSRESGISSDINNKRTGLRLNIEGRSEKTSVIKSLPDFFEELKQKKIDNFINGFIGCDSDEESYKNLLCELKFYLKNQYRVIEVSGSILPISNEEVDFVNNAIKDKKEKIKSCITLFKEYFGDSSEFENIIKEFSEKNKCNSVVENFTLKLLIWSIRIKDFLISNDKKALLYFGDIKSHEVYFLKLLKKKKINIIYIYSMEKYNVELSENAGLYIYKGCKFYDIKEYPKKSINEVRTSAYKAEKQVDNILYNEETGLYRPYQLNDKDISSIILRTTLEEAFILWNEEAKYRTGFINEENHVENPILFLKIDGVYNNIDDYYDLFIKMRSSNNTEVIDYTGIYTNNYNNQEYYSANYLFDSSEDIIVNKLKESSYYKYQYLDKNIQNQIIEKIDKIIKGEYLLFNKDKDFKIRVLLTILNLDDKFIKMLQSYNIGGEVPKIIFYNNNKDQYTKEDSIIIIFMILMGIDIVLFNPTGYLNIENMIDERIIPKFKLETVEYNLEIPDKIKNKKERQSFFRKLFNR